MPDSNEPQEPSTAPSGPDFNQEVNKAQATGDFDFVLETAKKSREMISSFRDAVLRASYPGRDAGPIAQGLQLLDTMVAQSAANIEGLKRAEKQTKEQMRAALKAKTVVRPSVVDGPELPADPPTVPPEDPKPETATEAS